MATKKTDKKPELNALAQRLSAQAGIMKKFDASPKLDNVVGVRPTGLAVLDEEVFGVGGLPKGKIIEVMGKESSGKTALALTMAGLVQKSDPNAVVKIYDAEHSWTYPWGKSMGLDLTDYPIGNQTFRRTILPTFRTAENMADQIHQELAEAPPDIIIIDSLAVLQPAQIVSKNVSDYNMNDNMARAAFLTRFFTSLLNGFLWPPGEVKNPHVSIDSSQTTLLCINHAKTRTVKAGGGKTYLEWYSVGGVSLDFCASIRLMVKKIGFVEVGSGANKRITHQKIVVTADKNKLAPPKKSCELTLSFEGGMEQVGSVDYLEMALNKSLAEKSGAWINSSLIPGGRIQGKENFNKLIHADPALKEMIMTATNII